MRPTIKARCLARSTVWALLGLATLVSPSTLRAQTTNGLIAWYPLDGSATNFMGTGMNGTAEGVVAWTTNRYGAPNSACVLDGVGLGYIRITDPEGLLTFDARSQEYTAAAWVRLDSLTGYQTIMIDRGSGGSAPISIWMYYDDVKHCFSAQVYDGGPSVRVNSSTTPERGRWYHVAMVVAQRVMKIYVDGVDETQADTNGGIVPPTFRSTMNGQSVRSIGRFSEAESQWRGALDDARIYDRALSPSNIADLATARPSFFEQPQSQSLPEGTNLTLSAIAAGDPPISYKWLRNGVEIVGQTNSALTVTGVVAVLDNGVYSAVASNAGGSATSALAIISVLRRPLEQLVDTDRDGLPDYYEVRFGLRMDDPSDASSLPSPADKLTWLQKYELGLSPLTADSDNDGVTDYDEIFVWHSNPNAADSDGDGIPDLWEIQNGLIPIVDDSELDNDSDGVSNVHEYRYSQTNALGQVLSPTKAFSILAGTNDFELINGLSSANVRYDKLDRLVGIEYANGTTIGYRYDGNGNILRQLTFNRFEISGGLPALWKLQSGLNPTNSSGMNAPYADPDGDGWSNYQEWRGGSNPTDAASVPTNTVQSAPVAIALPLNGVLSNVALVPIRLWDAEGNDASLELQWRFYGATEWSNAILARVDGKIYSPGSRIAATPEGFTHTAMWQAGNVVPPGTQANIYLRSRATDALAGNWSAPALYRLSIIADPDRDGDGIPDAWEYEYFGNLAQDATTDSDLDGFADLAEYIADTNPTNSASNLRITAMIRQQGSLKVDWQGGINATLHLQRSVGLSDPIIWSNIFIALPPTPLSGSYTDQVSTNIMLFYRIRATR